MRAVNTAGSGDFNIQQINLKTRKSTSSRKAHFVMIKQPMHPQDSKMIKTHIPKNSISTYKKQKLIELEEVDNSTVILEHIPLSITDRTTRQKK
jgi:hypothetical protein